MTEAEWQVATDFTEMLTTLFDGVVSGRKSTLLDTASFRSIWNLLSSQQRQSVEMLEKMADEHYSSVSATMELGITSWRAADIVGKSGGDSVRERQKQCYLIRDIFGNPFRPITFDTNWRTSTVVSLARSMYESRDFSTMPILSDALQDAGCENEDILNHCRGEGPHVRGCWVGDLVLGKE
jgi:hypothetical protein